MIELLTFTGVDNETPLAGLSDLARRYPRVEFGVLVGSHTGGIFPARSVVDDFKAYANAMGIGTALHLCGRYARTVADPRGVGATDLWELCAGFERIQVNLHGDWFNPERICLTGHEIEYFADRVAAERVILQHRGDWDSIPVKHEKVEYLFDVSEGGGIESFTDWPEPSSRLRRMGYAGGLGPANITRAIAFASEYPEAALWLDMESQVRTGGLFDLAAVEMVCEQVFRE